MAHDYSICCNELTRLHPQYGLAIHQLALRDRTFRAICEDYGEALNAAEIQRSKKKSADSKLEMEFRQIAEDLLTEAMAYISEKIEMKDPK